MKERLYTVPFASVNSAELVVPSEGTANDLDPKENIALTTKKIAENFFMMQFSLTLVMKAQ
jgi:hypothetical protein